VPPTWLPTSLLDSAEQRDFLGGVQPYLQNLQEQVSAGVTGLTSAANDVGRQLQELAAPRPAPMAPPPPMVQPQARPPSPPATPIEPFTLPSFERLTGGAQAAPTPTPAAGGAPRNATDPSPFRLPTFEDLTGFPETVRRTAQAAVPAVAAAGAAPPPSASGPPSRPGEIEAYIRQAAAARGIDPDTAMRVVMAEGGVSDPVRQSDVVYQGRRETSYGPLQLNTAGGVGSAALKAGIDPRDPAQWRQAVDFGLDEVARSGWGQWHGAARVGVGPRQGIGEPRTPVSTATAGAAPRPSPATTGPAGVPTAVAEGAGWRETWGKDLTPNQINETLNLGLSWDAALATCGVAASVAFARANGRAPTFKEALDLARATGEWNADVGMTRGTTGQLALLKGLGVEARAAPLAEGEVAAAVQRGQPVQINAHGNGGHFYVAQGYDPQTRKFDFGNSAAILKRSGGKTWFRLDELPSLGVGTPSEAIYLAGGR
jgi:hypothetical protein